MNQIEILLESKTARDGQLTKVTHEAAADTLSKAKALVFALWQGTGAATTRQMAEYYEVPEDTVQKIYQRNRAELLSDGVKTIKGKELKEVGDILSTSQERLPSLTIWTPRAALRLGMLLRDSQIAKQVRTVLLDVAEKVPDQEVQAESETIRELKLKIELAKLENRGRELDLLFFTELHRQAEPENPKEEFETVLLDVLKFIVERGGTITTRELCRSKFKSLKIGGKEFNAFMAHRLLRTIADAGYGKFEEKVFTADAEKCDRENLAKLSRWKSC